MGAAAEGLGHVFIAGSAAGAANARGKTPACYR